MSDAKSCPICGNNSEWTGLGPTHSKELFRCNVCGPFTITDYAIPVVNGLSQTEKGLLSGVIRERTEQGGAVELWEKDIRPILTTAPSDLLERVDRLLVNLVRKTKKFGQELTFAPVDSNLGFTLDQFEFRAQVSNLQEQNFIKAGQHDGQGGNRAVVVTATGLRKARDLSLQGGSYSNKAFVAMWFDPAMENIYSDGIEAGILATGFDPLRVDKI